MPNGHALPDHSLFLHSLRTARSMVAGMRGFEKARLCGSLFRKILTLAVVFGIWISLQANDAFAPGGERLYSSRAIGEAVHGEPWITNVKVADLDQDGLQDILVCDGRLNRVTWIRQLHNGDFEESALGDTIAGPVQTEAVDFDGDGDLDILVACMGIVIPTNERIGSVVYLENRGEKGFAQRTLIELLPRVTYVSAGDLNGDGRLDLIVGMFGFVDGEISWYENRGDWKFEGHSMLELSGTIHSPLCDIDNDGDLDVVALVSQDWEEVHVFENDGKGNFSGEVVYGALNQNFGSSGLTVADMDQDGDVDIVFTNGDGLDYATPGPRSWHGVQWLENREGGVFEYHRIADVPGAHSPLVVDLDGDGAKDIVVVSGFNDWTLDTAVSMILLRQIEGKRFEEVILGRQPTHLISVDGADFDRDGEVELVTGAFMYYPPFDHKSRVTLWENEPLKIGEI